MEEQFAQVFGEDRDTNDDTTIDPLSAALAASTDDATGVALLEDAGFVGAREAWSILARYRDTIALKMPDALGHERLSRLAPDLLRAVAIQGNATTTLERVMEVIESVAKRSVYLALLGERSIALSQFVQLCAASPWIARLLGRHPALFDELLDPRTLYAPLAPNEIDRDIAERLTALDDPDREHEMDCLRQSKQANVLRVAAADVSRRMPLMVVSDHLTEIAEAVLRAALGLAWRDITARHGRPASLPGGGAFAPYAVIAYGKLGGIELGYGSDLDLVFVHDDDPNAMTTGAKPVDLATFYARLIQRLIHILTTMTPQGVLYEVDPRLRPDGSKGVLVNTLDGLGEYLRGQGMDLGAPSAGESPRGGRRPGAGAAFRAPSPRHPAPRPGRRLAARRRADHARAHAHRARLAPFRPFRLETGPGRRRRHRVHGAVLHAALGRAARRRPRLHRQHPATRRIRAGGTDAGRGRHPARGRVPRLSRAHPRALAAGVRSGGGRRRVRRVPRSSDRGVGSSDGALTAMVIECGRGQRHERARPRRNASGGLVTTL